MSATPVRPSTLSGDQRDLLAIYTNLRQELVKLTAAGPLVERRDKYSKLENGERRGHEEGTQVREHIRMFFKIREILIEANLPLDAECPKTDELPKEKPAAKANTKPAPRNVEPLVVTPRETPFNPGMKSTPPPKDNPGEASYAASLSSTNLSPGLTTPVFTTRA